MRELWEVNHEVIGRDMLVHSFSSHPITLVNSFIILDQFS